MLTGSQNTIDYVRELHYQGLNRRTVELTDIANGKELFGEDWMAAGIIRAAALHELHLPQQALATIRSLVEENHGTEAQILYARARIAYQLGQHSEALELAREMSGKAQTLRDRFRGLLVEGNVQYSENKLDAIPSMLEELRPLSNQLPDDDKIGLIMLRANYERAKGGFLLQASRESFCEAASLAAGHSWSHFVNRALYGLALSLKAEGNEAELRSTLRILKCLVVPSESLLMTHWINSDFQESNFSIGIPVEFDESRMRIIVNGKPFALHEKPLIFAFLNLLHGHDKFLSKEDISEKLWSPERYNPLTHDARIFDIAKRARAVIETFDQQPVVLLSGRLGYKLANK